MRVFFSFDYSEDRWRASVVRNSWITDPAMANGAFWEPEFSGPRPPTGSALTRIVEQEVRGAEVVAVLIGERTARCEHVQYAIRRGAELGRGLLGIYIDQIPDRYGSPGRRGLNPFERMSLLDGEGEALSNYVKTYDWVADDGFDNLAAWIEDAARSRPPRRPRSS